MRCAVILASLLLLSACGHSAYGQAQEDVMESKSTYKSCLDDHDGNTAKCTGERVNYETDTEALKNMK